MARKIVEARDGRWGMLCGCSYAEPWMRDRAPRYDSLPVPDEDLDKAFYAGDLMICRDIPTAVPNDAYDFPGPLSGTEKHMYTYRWDDRPELQSTTDLFQFRHG